MRSIVAAVAMVGLLLVGNSTNSKEVTVKTYKAVKAKGGLDWNILTVYFSGEGAAFGWANAELINKHKPPFYCAPDGLGLNSENFISIIDDTITRWKLSDDDLVDVYFLPALEFTFPCKP